MDSATDSNLVVIHDGSTNVEARVTKKPVNENNEAGDIRDLKQEMLRLIEEGGSVGKQLLITKQDIHEILNRLNAGIVSSWAKHLRTGPDTEVSEALAAAVGSYEADAMQATDEFYGEAKTIAEGISTELDTDSFQEDLLVHMEELRVRNVGAKPQKRQRKSSTSARQAKVDSDAATMEKYARTTTVVKGGGDSADDSPEPSSLQKDHAFYDFCADILKNMSARNLTQILEDSLSLNGTETVKVDAGEVNRREKEINDHIQHVAELHGITYGANEAARLALTEQIVSFLQDLRTGDRPNPYFLEVGANVVVGLMAVPVPVPIPPFVPPTALDIPKTKRLQAEFTTVETNATIPSRISHVEEDVRTLIEFLKVPGLAYDNPRSRDARFDLLGKLRGVSAADPTGKDAAMEELRKALIEYSTPDPVVVPEVGDLLQSYESIMAGAQIDVLQQTNSTIVLEETHVAQFMLTATGKDVYSQARSEAFGLLGLLQAVSAAGAQQAAKEAAMGALRAKIVEYSTPEPIVIPDIQGLVPGYEETLVAATLPPQVAFEERHVQEFIDLLKVLVPGLTYDQGHSEDARFDLLGKLRAVSAADPTAKDAAMKELRQAIADYSVPPPVNTPLNHIRDWAAKQVAPNTTSVPVPDGELTIKPTGAAEWRRGDFQGRMYGYRGVEGRVKPPELEGTIVPNATDVSDLEKKLVTESTLSTAKQINGLLAVDERGIRESLIAWPMGRTLRVRVAGSNEYCRIARDDKGNLEIKSDAKSAAIPTKLRTLRNLRQLIIADPLKYLCFDGMERIIFHEDEAQAV